MTVLLGLILAGLLGAWWWERRQRRAGPVGSGLQSQLSLPHAQEFELYHNSFSLCSKKLRVCLAELGLDYASHPIDLVETGSYQNIGREFLRVNPAGTVPVLVHQGHPIYESHEQIVYAARHAGARGAELLPAAPEERALVEAWTDRASLVGDPLRGLAERAGHCIPGSTVPLFATAVAHIPWSRFLAGLLFHPDKRRPIFLSLLKQRGVTRLPAKVLEMIARSRDHMERHLDALSEQLDKTGGPWIAGARFSLADVSWVVILDRLVEADWEAHFWGGARRPTLAAYWQRLRERPSYASAIAGVRSRTIDHGIADLAQAKREHPALRVALEGSG